jgi:hypothetical protein
MIKETMSEASSTHGGIRNSYRVIIGKLVEGWRSLGTSWRRLNWVLKK